MRPVDAEVVIVGYGPVGMTLAILLAQHGRSVVVLERWPGPYHLPRAVHVDHQVARILQSAGVGDRLAEISEPADSYEWRNGEGTVLLRLGRSGAGSAGWPQSLMLHQPSLESALDRRARDLGVDVRRGADVTDLHQERGAVTAVTGTGDTVSARYAVGCDGANSTVREVTGLPVQDLGFFYDWLIVDMRLHEPRTFEPSNVQICDPGRPTTVVSGGPGRRRWEFMRLPHESRQELNCEDRAWELLGPWEVRPDNATVERHAVYTFGARFASGWRTGAVFLAGDAAHQMPPFAGQGMCTGIRDAANLAWKLALVLAGEAPDRLLDTYDQERLPSARHAIEFSMELGKVICVPDPVAAAERDAAMAAQVADEAAPIPPLPGIRDGVVDSGSPGAGTQFVQGMVGGRRFDDVHGAGWRLVTLGGDPPEVDPELGRWFSSIGGCSVSAGRADPVYERWFAGHGATAVLQRPDFCVFGSATGRDGPAILLDRLHTQLTGGPRGVRR